MSSCLLDFRGVEKQQHAARSDDNLVLFDNCFMFIEHVSSCQCKAQEKPKSNILLSAAYQVLSKFPITSIT